MSGSYAINTGQNFSVFAWVYPTAGLRNTFPRGMILNTSYAYIDLFKDGWSIGLGNTATDPNPLSYNFFFTTGKNGSTDASYKTATNIVPLNQWNYVGVTVANSANLRTDMLLYRNGVNIADTFRRNTNGTIQYIYPTTTLGARYNTSTPDWFPGNIAAAHIYNRVLTPQEISQNYNAYKSRFGLT
jgi:hypothetical protein